MTIYGYPPSTRVEPATSPILSGAPVSSMRTWQPLTYGVNWLNGIGAQLIPGCSTEGGETITAGSTGTFNFRVMTRAQSIERIWSLAIFGSVSGVVVSINVNGYGAITATVPSTGYIMVPVPYREILAAQSKSRQDFQVTVSPTGGDVVVQSISCFEQYRAALAQSANDSGINATTTRPGERVYVGNYSTSIVSVGGITNAMAASDPRRVGILHWSATQENAPVSVSTTDASILTLAMPVLTRKLTSGQTTGTVYWSAYVKANPEHTGIVKISTSHSGVADSTTYVNSSWAWTTPRAISIDCENMSAADGRQGASWDELQIKFACSFALQTVYLAAVSVWEE